MFFRKNVPEKCDFKMATCDFGDLMQNHVYLFDDDRTMRYSRMLLEALACLNRLKIIHRDIKPHNILYFDNDQLQLADFGLATYTDQKPMATMVGTKFYMSPEMLIEDYDHGHAEDIWSLGCTIAEMSAM